MNFCVVRVSGLELKQKFTEDSQRLYESKPVALEGLEQVNSWVEQATKGKMPEFLTSLPPNLLLMLINAVHFKGISLNLFFLLWVVCIIQC